MSFEKRKAMKNIVEDFERDDLAEPTHSAEPSLFVPKKDGAYHLVVEYCGMNKHIEKTSWPLPRINEVYDSMEGKMYFSNNRSHVGIFSYGARGGESEFNSFYNASGPL